MMRHLATQAASDAPRRSCTNVCRRSCNALRPPAGPWHARLDTPTADAPLRNGGSGGRHQASLCSMQKAGCSSHCSFLTERALGGTARRRALTMPPPASARSSIRRRSTYRVASFRASSTASQTRASWASHHRPRDSVSRASPGAIRSIFGMHAHGTSVGSGHARAGLTPELV